MTHSADQSSNQQQIVQATFDVALQAVKVVLEGTTEISLSSVDDSVLAVNPTVATSAAVTNAAVSGDIVVPAFDVSQIAQLNIITNTTVTLVSTNPLLTLQLSPSATDNVWISTALTVTPSGTLNTVVAGTPLAINLYKRARVKLTFDDYTSGGFTVYVNGR